MKWAVASQAVLSARITARRKAPKPPVLRAVAFLAADAPVAFLAGGLELDDRPEPDREPRVDVREAMRSSVSAGGDTPVPPRGAKQVVSRGRQPDLSPR